MQIKKVVGIVAILLLAALVLAGAGAADSSGVTIGDNDSVLQPDTLQGIEENVSDAKIELTDKTISVYLVNLNNEKSSSFIYNGTAVTPKVVIKNTDTSEILREGTDYVVSYWNNNGPGIGHVGIIGCGSYTGQIELTFDIEEETTQSNSDEVDDNSVSESNTEESSASISDSRYLKYLVNTENIRSETFEYTGDAVSPKVVITNTETGETLKEGTDYVVSYSNNIESGIGYAGIDGCGSYTGYVEIPFTIKEPSVATNSEILNLNSVLDSNKDETSVSICDDSIIKYLVDSDNISTDTFEYSGESVSPKVVMLDSTTGKYLIDGRDYSTIYRKNVECGTGYAVVTGRDSYTGTVEIPFTIEKIVADSSESSDDQMPEVPMVFMTASLENENGVEDHVEIYTPEDTIPVNEIIKISAALFDKNGNQMKTDSYDCELKITDGTGNVSILSSWKNDYDFGCEVKGVSVGTATIEASCSGFTSDSSTITVYNSIPTSIEISNPSENIPVNETMDIIAWVYDQNGRVINTELYDCKWTITDGTGNVSILSSWKNDYDFWCKVKGVSEGTATIQASCSDLISEPCTITVYNSIPTSLEISNPSENIPVNETVELYAFIRDQNGNQVKTDSYDCTWTIDEGEEYITIVSSKKEEYGFLCEVKGVAEGTATIKASCSDLTSDSCSITVYKRVPTSISIIVNDGYLPVDETTEIHAWVYDQDGRVMDTDSCDFTLKITEGSDYISLVSSEKYSYEFKYILKGVAEGTATIKASCSDITSESRTITVYDSVPTSIEISSSNKIPVNETREIYATILDQNGRKMNTESYDCTWEITDGAENVTVLSSKKEEYGFLCEVKGVAEGTATIKASCQDLKSDSSSINVYKKVPSSIWISYSSENIPIDETTEFSVSVNDQYGNQMKADSYDCTWEITSGKDKVSIVTTYTRDYQSLCVVKGVAEGSATIRASCSDLTSDSRYINVYRSIPASINIQSDVYLSPGSTKTLGAWVVDSTGRQLSYEPVNFSIKSGDSVTLTRSGGSDSHYVTLSTTGNPGKTVIEVSSVNYPDVIGTSTVTVNESSEFVINFGYGDLKYDYDYYKGKESYAITTASIPGRLEAYVYDEYGSSINDKTLTWSLHDTQVQDADGSWISADDSAVLELIPLTDASNPTRNILLKPKAAGKTVVTATLDDDENATKSVTITVSEPTEISILSNIPEDITDEMNSSSWNVYGVDNLGLTVTNPAIDVIQVDGKDSASITTSQYSRTFYNYNYGVLGKHVHIDPVEGKAGTSTTINISTDDERFTEKEKIVSININSVDNDKVTISVGYPEYNNYYWTITNEYSKTTVESDCSFNAWVRDQYGYDTARNITWEYSGCIPSTGTEITDHYISLTPQESGKNMVVTAKDGSGKSSVSTTITYSVEETVLTSVYQSVSSTNLTLNSTGSAHATGRDQYGKDLPYDVQWKSSNENVLKVEAYNSGNHYKNANLIPVSKGKATITATVTQPTSEKTLSWDTEINVEESIVSSVVIQETMLIPKNLNNSYGIYAQIFDQYGNSINDNSLQVTWSVDQSTNIISYSPEIGNTRFCSIKGLNEGTAKITATCESIPSSECIITVYTPEPTSFEVESSCSVGVGYERNIGLSVWDQYGDWMQNPQVSWNVVSGNDVISLTTPIDTQRYCTITGLKEGTATIHVSCDGITESKDISVTVYQPVLDKLVLNRYSISVGSGSTKWIYGYLRDSEGNQMKTDSYDCTWTITDDTGTAVVQSSGKDTYNFWCYIKGVTAGDSSIQASCSGLTSEPCSITVYDQVPTSIRLDEVYISPNNSSECFAYLVDQFGSDIDSSNIPFNWKVELGDDVISLTPSTSEQKNFCVIKGLKEGTAKVSASYGEGESLLSSETEVTVYTPIPATIDVQSSYYVGVGYEKELYANVWDQYGQWMQNPPISWNVVSGDDVISITTSSDTQRYCTINGLKEGTATIRLSCTGLSETKDISVSVYTPVLKNIRINSDLTYIAKDSTSTINAYLYDQNGNQMKTGSYDCTWTITDGTENAKIISTGKNVNNFWCSVNGITEGDAKIQVSCSDLSSNTCLLSVYTPVPKELDVYWGSNEYVPVDMTTGYFANVRDQTGRYISNPDVSFEITDGSEHLKITECYDQSCVVKGISSGTATLKATCGDLSSTTIVEIYTQEPKSVSLNLNNKLPVGSIISGYGYILDQHGYSIKDKTLEIICEVIDENGCVDHAEVHNQNYLISLLGKKEGTVTINATCGTLTPASTNVTVYTPSAERLVVSSSSYMPVNSTDSVIWAYRYDSNGYRIDDSDIIYTWNIIEGNDVIALTPLTENANKCSIACLSEGTAKISVSDGSGLSVERTITVYTPNVNGVNISGSSTVPVGGSNSRIYADAYDQYGNSISNADIEFHVDEAGSSIIRLDPIAEETNVVKVVGLSSGSATVTATCDTFSSSLMVSTYTPEITSLYTSLSSLSGIPIGSPVTITVGGRDQKGNYSTAFTENVELVSGPGNVSITKDVEKTEKYGGYYYYNLTGISEGDVTLRVTCGDLSEEFVLPVYTPVLTSLQISGDSFTSPAGSDASIQVYGLDQQERIMDVDMVSCRWKIIEGDDVISISPRFPHNDIVDISLKKNGFAKIQATYGDVSSNICLVECGTGLWGSYTPTISEEEPAYVVATPTFSPAGGTYSTFPSTVSISSSVSNSKTYYAIDDGYTEEYTGPITITLPSGTESFTVHAAVKDEKGVYSKNVTAEYILGAGPGEEKHTITIAKSAGGTVTSNVSKAKTGDIVTLTFTPDTGYYLAGWTISDGKGTEEAKSSTVNTFSMWDSDVVITATFEPEEYTVTIAESEGGSVTSDVSKAKTGDIVTLTFTPDTGYLKGNWSVVGEDGTTVSKSSSVSTFNMLGQNVTVYATFTQDTTPKPTTVKITNAAGSIYVGDMGTLYATTYDQFGKQYSKDKVTWSSSSSSILSINAADGSYVALDNGEVTVTAISTEDSSVSGTITLTVDLPPSPYISGLDAPSTAEYGKMSDDFIVNSENTTYLNWNWGDGSDSRTTTKDSTHSVDYVAHTFVPTEAGDVTVKIVPSNTYYAGGEEKTTTINVVYPSPSNVKITEGPSSVVAGDSVSYTGFATGVDSYIWSFNDTVLTGQTGSTVSFTVPTNAPSVSTLKLTAVKSSASPTSVEKTVYVAQPAAPLGEFGELTTSPENPAKGDAVVLSITPVENASTYAWVINGMSVSKGSSPSIVYSSSSEGDVNITVTASNSSGTDTKSQNYTYYVGKKPEFTISPESGEGFRGKSVTYKASATYGTDLIWSWAIDGTVKQTSDSDEFTYNWKSDAYGYHVITVKATSDYGTTTKNYSYQVVPKTGVAPEITNIEGSQNLDVDSLVTYKATFACSDAYTISWYLNGELKQQKTNVQSGNNVYTVHDLSPGSYTIKVILTTEYEETAEFSKNISVLEYLEETTADSNVPNGSDMQNISVNDSKSGSTALKNVDTVKIDSGDLSGDAGDVVIEANVIPQDELKGFTPEMGNKEDALISVELTPTGLKNEKKLESGAVVTFRLLKSSIGNPDQIGFFRLDTKDEIEKWVKLTVLSYKEEGEYILFTVKTSGFSTFVATPVAVTQDTPEPTPDKGSSSSVTAFDGVKSGDNFTFENAVVITKATLPGASSAKVINTSGSEWYNFTLTADGFNGNGTLYFQVPLDVISVKGWTTSDVSLLGCKTTYLGTEGKYAKYSAVITNDGAYTIDFEAGAAGTSSGTTDVKPVDVSVSISGASAMKVGDTTVFTANNSDGSSAKFAWKSSDASIATVDENGNIKALKEGTVTITVTNNLTGKTASKTILIGAKATETTAAKTPGFGILAVLVGLGAAGVFVARRK